MLLWFSNDYLGHGPTDRCLEAHRVAVATSMRSPRSERSRQWAATCAEISQFAAGRESTCLLMERCGGLAALVGSQAWSKRMVRYAGARSRLVTKWHRAWWG